MTASEKSWTNKSSKSGRFAHQCVLTVGDDLFEIILVQFLDMGKGWSFTTLGTSKAKAQSDQKVQEFRACTHFAFAM